MVLNGSGIWTKEEVESPQKMNKPLRRLLCVKTDCFKEEMIKLYTFPLQNQVPETTWLTCAQFCLELGALSHFPGHTAVKMARKKSTHSLRVSGILFKSLDSKMLFSVETDTWKKHSGDYEWTVLPAVIFENPDFSEGQARTYCRDSLAIVVPLWGVGLWYAWSRNRLITSLSGKTCEHDSSLPADWLLVTQS